MGGFAFLPRYSAPEKYKKIKITNNLVLAFLSAFCTKAFILTLLDAEVKIGELMAKLPKQNTHNRAKNRLDSGVASKTENKARTVEINTQAKW